MKKVTRTPYEIAIRIAVPVLLVALCTLTVVTISMISRSNAAVPSFDLDSLTNETRQEDVDVSGCLLPEFIGITTAGSRAGISASYNLVSELYGLLSPTVYRALSASVPLSSDVEGLWEACIAAENSVYLRYHTELPDGIIALFAALSMGEDDPAVPFHTDVREMFILPYASGGETAETVLVTRSTAGDVRKYVVPVDRAPVSVNEMERFVRSYSSRMETFRFNEGSYPVAAASEPIFSDALSTRTLRMQRSAFIQNSPEECDTLLRIFGFNPDKLLNVHEDGNGGAVYYDTQGILELRDSAFEYVRSYADSGLETADLLPDASESGSLADYVRSAVVLFRRIRAIDRNYAGGDADIVLASASSAEGEVTLTFRYTVDNVCIADANAAFEITFSGKKILRAELYTILVQLLAERSTSFDEWWFVSVIGKPAANVRLVYRADYSAEEVAAEWAAEIPREADTDLHVPQTERTEMEENHGK